MPIQEASQRHSPIARLMHFLRSWSFMLLVSALAGSLPVSAQEDADLVIVDTDGTTLKAYTVDELAALPQHKIVTGNEFVEGKVTFEGPLVRDVLKDAGLEPGEKLAFVALNDYAVEIPASELEKYDAILALKADGKWLSRRDKGPIWVIYPMDDHPELQDPVFNSRLVWQLARIEKR